MNLRELLKRSLNDKETMAEVISLFTQNLDLKKETKNIASALARMIEELINLPINNESKPKIYVVKQYDYLNEMDEDYDTFCIYEGDILHYGYYETDWKYLIDAEVFQKSIEKYGAGKVVYSILFELSWYGYEYEKVKKRQDEFIRHIEELETKAQTDDEKVYMNLESLKSELNVEMTEEEEKAFDENLKECKRLNEKEIRDLGIEYLYPYLSKKIKM